jgi:iron(III) transport system permease protein
LLAVPLIQPFGRVLHADAWDWSTDDLERIRFLARNTSFLIAGTCAIAVPAGTLLAVLLFRTAFVGRRLLLALLALLLFVPLPVIVSSWQAFLGAGGLLPISFWITGTDRPWATGWGPAIWVHAVASLPWVTWIVGLGLGWVEPELEEQAALELPVWRVLWQVTLPRCRASIAAAALFVGLKTAGEISVTEMMQIRTLAEEVYTQFITNDAAIGRTLVLSLPALLALVGVLTWAAGRLERVLPPLPVLLRPARPLGGPGWLGALFVIVTFAAMTVPLAGLWWKLGEAGEPRGWSPLHAWHQLAGEAHLLGPAMIRALGMALTTGALVAGLALVCCWLARDSRWLRQFVLVLAMAAWVAPGPVVGIGLQELILSLPDGPWQTALYYGPSPLPIMWVHTIRFLPVAVFFLWPVVRLLPRELSEAARLEGAGPAREFRFVIWPQTWRAAGVIALAVSALTLGEHEAAKRVETPRWESFAFLLFDRMHYGASGNVAALSLLLLGGVAAIALLGVAGGAGLAASLRRAHSANALAGGSRLNRLTSRH